MISKALLAAVAVVALTHVTSAQEVSGRSGQPHRTSVKTHLDRGQFDHVLLPDSNARAVVPSLSGIGSVGTGTTDAAEPAAANPHLFEPGVTLH